MYTLVWNLSHGSHVLLIYEPWGLRDQCLNWKRRQLNFQNKLKTVGLFTLRSIQASNHVVAPPFLPHPKSTMHHQFIQHFWLNPDCARGISILIAYICIVIVALSSLSEQWHHSQSSNVGAFGARGLRCPCFLDQSCHCCCASHAFVCTGSQSKHLHCKFLQRCTKVLLQAQLPAILLQFQPRQSWYGKALNFHIAF